MTPTFNVGFTFIRKDDGDSLDLGGYVMTLGTDCRFLFTEDLIYIDGPDVHLTLRKEFIGRFEAYAL